MKGPGAKLHSVEFECRNLVEALALELPHIISGVQGETVELCRLRVGLDRDLVRLLESVLRDLDGELSRFGIGERDVEFHLFRLTGFPGELDGFPGFIARGYVAHTT